MKFEVIGKVICAMVIISFGMLVWSIYTHPYFNAPKTNPVSINTVTLEVSKAKPPKMDLTKFIKYLQPKLDDNSVKIYNDSVLASSTKYKLPPLLILSLIQRESNFDQFAVSSVGAVGCMQVLFKYHKDKLESRCLTIVHTDTIKYNVDIGCEILSEYYKPTKNIEKALLRYVGGNHASYVTDVLRVAMDLTILNVRTEDTNE